MSTSCPDDCMYEELLETWFPTNSHPPSAFLLDTSEEALLLPDWLKLKMIRSKVQRVVDAGNTFLIFFVKHCFGERFFSIMTS